MRHIIWDWNGTLLDDAEAIFRCSNAVFTARGLPAVTPEQYRASYTRPLTEFYRRLFGRALTEAELAGMDDDFHDTYRGELPEIPLAPDAQKALAGWRERGGSQSLLSMFRHDELMEQVRARGLEDEFVRIDGLVGTGGGMKAEHLRRHLDVLALAPDEVLMVGDSLDDVAAAHAVGAAAVLYDGPSGGVHAPELLRAAGVPVVDSLTSAYLAR
jgi:phosphoglycolate phosphatase-like HAD superfamily hydrolase